ncbi:MAG: hypothetical protein EKK69_04020 [Candidatus Competibacteraceae bacterium]|nr:MAG: hypothetical protein EKK69_04020 [Candidatus Competibacteraceae bacterium]
MAQYRDINAATDILSVGLAILAGADQLRLHEKLRRDTLDLKPAEFESVSDGPIPKEQRPVKQEPGRQQPRIPILQGGEDVNGYRDYASRPIPGSIR